MRIAKIIFLVAGIWGVLVLTPLYFIFYRIGQMDPSRIRRFSTASSARVWPGNLRSL
jgi:hypothetical protein